MLLRYARGIVEMNATLKPPRGSTTRHQFLFGIIFGATIFLQSLLHCLLPTTAQAEPFLEISESSDGFTIDAENVSVSKILRGLGAKADFSVVDQTGATETLAIFAIEDAVLSQVLATLLANTNHLLVYGGADTAQVTRVVLMRTTTQPARAQTNRARQASPLAGPGAKTPPTPPIRGTQNPSDEIPARTAEERPYLPSEEEVTNDLDDAADDEPDATRADQEPVAREEFLDDLDPQIAARFREALGDEND